MTRTSRALAALALLVAGCSEGPADGAGNQTTAPPSVATSIPAPGGDVAAPSDGSAVTATDAASPTRDGGAVTEPGESATTGAGATASTPPPVGIPGGVPGAAPLTTGTEEALLALLTAEAEAGGQAYRLEPSGDGWVVTVRVFDGSRAVEVGEDGATARSVTEAPAGPETAALDTARILVAEGAEVAVADAPGDLSSVVLVRTRDAAYWEVTVDTAEGERTVRVDVATGERS